MKKNRQQILNNKKRKQGEAVRNREKEIKQSASIRERLKKEADERAASQRYYRRQREMIHSMSRLDRGYGDRDIGFIDMLMGGGVLPYGMTRHYKEKPKALEPNTIDLTSDNYTVKDN